MAISSLEALMLAAAVTLAGLVRGFSGFGSAMIFMPVAGRIVGPFEAILIFTVVDFFGPIPLLPRALRDGALREVAWLLAFVALALPVGMWLLTISDPAVFRWVVSIAVFVLLVALIGGFRHRLPFNLPTLGGTGLVAGLLGGLSGLGGPPVILLYLASNRATELIRANTLIFLVGFDVIMSVALLAFGRFDLGLVLIGLVLLVPYTLAGLLGQRLFDPARAGVYRAVAYLIIGASALQGLPIWDGMFG
ncbi:MAG: TSUP family transporter [Rhodobacteraceae bacterium]|nr:TSUP family transporter [Paracoccaceae bacterium]